jgi:hypothetical protein
MPFRAPGHYLSPSLLPIFSFPIVTPWSIQHFQRSNLDIGHASLHTWDAGLDFFLDYETFMTYYMTMSCSAFRCIRYLCTLLYDLRCRSVYLYFACIHNCGWIYVDWDTDYLYYAAAMPLAINFVSGLCRRWRGVSSVVQRKQSLYG